MADSPAADPHDDVPGAGGTGAFERGVFYPLRAFAALGWRALWLFVPPLLGLLDEDVIGTLRIPWYARFVYFAGVCVAAALWVDRNAPEPTRRAQLPALALGALGTGLAVSAVAGYPWLLVAAAGGFWLFGHLVHEGEPPWAVGSHRDAAGAARKAYPEKAAAVAAARRHERARPGERMRVYRCARCPDWHIGPASTPGAPYP